MVIFFETESLHSVQILAGVSASSINITFGISTAFSAILIPQLEDPSSDLHLTLAQSSWIASIVILSGIAGSLAAGPLSESVGRLAAIKLCVIPCVIGWALIAIATNFWSMVVGRILVGFGVGIGGATFVVYVTEIARPDIRGSLISCGVTLASFGALSLSTAAELKLM